MRGESEDLKSSGNMHTLERIWNRWRTVATAKESLYNTRTTLIWSAGVHPIGLQTAVWTDSNLLSNRIILVLFESCLETCMTYTIAECTVNKLLMMGRETVRNM